MNKFNAPNNIFQNWNKELYIARKKDVEKDEYHNEIVVYDEPYFFGRVNYQPLTGKNLEAFKQEYGETENSIVSCLINYTDLGKFDAFDLAYLYGANPKNESINGNNANYKVRAFKPQNTKIMVLFEKLTIDSNDR